MAKRKKKVVRKTTRRKTARKAQQSAPAVRESPAAYRVVRHGRESYTAFDLNDERIEEALASGADRDLLEEYFGEATYREFQELARESTRRRARGRRVLILPGIMGSRLGYAGRAFFGDSIWFDPIDIMQGRLSELALNGSTKITALGVLLTTYLRLKLRLQLVGLDARFFPYDWRRDIASSGRLLATALRQERDRNGHQEIDIVAHSMGGLVGRAALRELGHAGPVRRLITLGTPHHGSFSPVLALRATHDMVRKLAYLDLAPGHDAAYLAEQIFAGFPGLCELLPARTHYPATNFFDVASWPAAPKLRAAILRKADLLADRLAPPDDRFRAIVGVNQETIHACRSEGDDFIYQTTMAGDGTVPLAFAELEDTRTWYVEEGHGSLPNNSRVIRAVIDLLKHDRTDLLPSTWDARRPGGREIAERDLRAREPFGDRRGARISPAEIRHLLEPFAAPPRDAAGGPGPVVTQREYSSEPITIGRRRQQQVEIRLARGNIANVSARAIVLGIFEGVAPSGPAAAIDERLGGVIRTMSERRMFDGSLGELSIIPAGRRSIATEMVILAGLGSYDAFTPDALELVAANVARSLALTHVEEFATVVFGVGSGMEMRSALRHLIRGFVDGLGDATEHRVRSICLCEYDPQRYRILREELLQLTMGPLFDGLAVTIEEEDLAVTVAAPTRREPREPDPTYLYVRRPEPDRLSVSILTADSRAAIIAADINLERRRLDEQLAALDSLTFRQVPAFGRKLAELVLPETVRQVLAHATPQHVVVIHDAASAGIPWETLHIDEQPLALGGLTHHLEVRVPAARWLQQRRLDESLRVLLIINPTEDLPGAEDEGQRLIDLLPERPTLLRRAEATRAGVTEAFRSGRYDVVHYAGHAFFDADDREHSGLVCADGVLTGADLRTSGQLPALVVFNACEAARVRGPGRRRIAGADKPRQMLRANAGIAESLMRGGLANYIGTYWPVGDEAAAEFAATLYRDLIAGETLGTATTNARRRMRDQRHLDWANYIHYGSWRFRVKLTGA